MKYKIIRDIKTIEEEGERRGSDETDIMNDAVPCMVSVLFLFTEVCEGIEQQKRENVCKGRSKNSGAWRLGETRLGA